MLALRSDLGFERSMPASIMGRVMLAGAAISTNTATRVVTLGVVLGIAALAIGALRGVGVCAMAAVATPNATIDSHVGKKRILVSPVVHVTLDGTGDVD
jgi:hypothetical protein